MVPTQIVSVGGYSNDYIDMITSVAATNDGGYIAGGYFSSGEIKVGDYVLKNNSSIEYGYQKTDGIVIKYDVQGNVEWATNIEGTDNESIDSVVSTSDGGCIDICETK